MRTKKILILSSLGGYGHIAAANTLNSLLGNEYQIETVYPIKELRLLGIPSAEMIYNFLLSNNLIRLTNWIARYVAPIVFFLREKKTIAQIQQHIETKKPDVVISLIPFVNYPATEATRKCGVPLLIATTDNDLYNWCVRLNQMKNENIKVTIGSELSTSRTRLLQLGIPEEKIETTGLPLRPDFIQTKDKEELRQIYEIPRGKDVVLIMMGGMGSRSAYQYVKMIMQSPLNVHLVVCTGKNRRLAKNLKRILPAKGNSIDIVPFTEKIHEFFALSDLVITKPGPGTVNEAFALKLPILIDQMGVPLFWEQINIDLVLSKKVGACIKSLEDVPDLIRRFLNDEQTREAVARAYEELPENQFADRIHSLINEMCGDTLSGEVLLTSRNITSQL